MIKNVDPQECSAPLLELVNSVKPLKFFTKLFNDAYSKQDLLNGYASIDHTSGKKKLLNEIIDLDDRFTELKTKYEEQTNEVLTVKHNNNLLTTEVSKLNKLVIDQENFISAMKSEAKDVENLHANAITELRNTQSKELAKVKKECADALLKAGDHETKEIKKLEDIIAKLNIAISSLQVENEFVKTKLLNAEEQITDFNKDLEEVLEAGAELSTDVIPVVIESKESSANNARFTCAQIKEMKELRSKNMPFHAIASQFGTVKSVVMRAIKGETYSNCK